MTIETKKHYFNVLDTQKSQVKYYYVKNDLLYIPIINAGVFDHELNAQSTIKYLPPIMLVFENVKNVELKFYEVNKLILKIQNIGLDSDDHRKDCFGFNIVDSKHYLEIEINSDNAYFYLFRIEDAVSFEDLEKTLDIFFENGLPNSGKFQFRDLQSMAIFNK